MALDVFDDDDGVVDDQAGGQGDAEQRERVDGEAQQLNEGERSDERDRDGDGGNDGGTPVLEENEDDKDDEKDGGAQGRDHVADGFSDGVGGVEGDLIFHAGRKALGQAVEFGDALLVNVERVGGGKLSDRDTDRFAPVVIEVVGIVFGAEFGVADIFQANQRAIGIAFEDDVIELSGFGKAADGANADLEILAGHGGLGSDLSGGDFDVLLAESSYHIVGGEGAAGHADGIEPEAHGIFSFAEDEDVGHAGNALQGVANINVKIVADEEGGVALVGRKDRAAEDEILRGLGDGDSDLLDGGGEPSGSSVDAVLDVNRSEVGIAAEVESGGDGADAIVGAGGGDVLHALSAVDLLLEGGGNSGFDGLGAGSGIDGRDADLRRREIGKLRDGKRGDADGACENDQQGADGREYGAMNKKVDHSKTVLSSRLSVLSSRS